MSCCTVILREPCALVLYTQNPCALRAQGGRKNSSQRGAKGGLAPKPFVTWGGAHWHPTVWETRVGRIHVKELLQNITVYLKYGRENV